MVRIGKQIAHFEFIDLSSIEAVFSKGKTHRYALSMQYANSLLDRDRTKQLAVILKNPSAADERMADNTIRKVESFVYRQFTDVRHLHILNMMALRATDPGEVNEVLATEGPLAVIGIENDRIIRIVLSECDYVILAWGNNSGIDAVFYEERIEQVKSLLADVPSRKLFRIQGETQTKHPLHGLMWGYRYKVVPAHSMLEAR
jgi:hypothetical protein